MHARQLLLSLSVGSLVSVQFYDNLKMFLQKDFATTVEAMFRGMTEQVIGNSTEQMMGNSTEKGRFGLWDALTTSQWQLDDSHRNVSVAAENHTEYPQQRLEYADYKARFPISEYLEEYLTTQPPSTQEQLLKNPNEKFLVMTCHKYDRHKPEDCGGLADRLKNVAYWVWLAQQSGRRLLIKYSKPFPLEEFLVPPDESQFDWRLPDGYFDKEFEAYANRTADQYKAMRKTDWHNSIFESPWNNTRVIFVNNNLAMPAMVRKMEGLFHESYSRHIVPGIFRRLFRPAPGVQEAIDQTVKQHGLVAGQYASAHLRLKYPFMPPKRIVWGPWDADKNGGGLSMGHNRTAWNVHLLSDNAINCAMEVMPEARHVYFASDANEAAQYLVGESPFSFIQLAKNTSLNVTDTQNHVPKVVTRLDVDKESAHFDSDKRKVDPTAIYSTFVDLWIMAHAKCVSHGVGGFGQFVSQLTGNYDTCRVETRSHKGVVTYCPEYWSKFGLEVSRREVIPH